MGDSETVADPIEMLVELAKKGEIDPWHIDIVSATDAFLRRLEHMREMSLAVPARTLFYASVLLRMKSEALTEQQDEPLELDEPEEDIAVPAEYPRIHVPATRRTRRPATLDELIAELKKAERVEQRRAVRKAEKEVRAEYEIDVVDVAHEEDLEDAIDMVKGKLHMNLPAGKRLTLGELITEMSDVPAVLIYLSLLFLANERAIWLEQDEMFSELYITRRT